jgi:hypothetical protein
MLGLLLALISSEPTVTFEKIERDIEGRLDVHLSYPIFHGSTALTKFASEQAKECVLDQFEEFKRTVDVDNPPPNTGHVPLFRLTSVVSVVSWDLIAVFVESYSDPGDAHGMMTRLPMNFGIVNGKPKKLRLADLLIEGAEPEDVITNKLFPLLQEAKRKRGWERLWFTPAQQEKFVITPVGLSWTFGDYDVGPYAEGGYIIKVPWSDLPVLDSLPARLKKGVNAQRK